MLNLGIPGRDFPSHAEVGHKAIQALRPRGILLQFTLNDVARYAEGFGCTNPAIWSLPVSWQPLAKHSYLLVAANRASTALRSALGEPAELRGLARSVSHADPRRPGYLRASCATTGPPCAPWLRDVDFVLLLALALVHRHAALSLRARARGGGRRPSALGRRARPRPARVDARTCPSSALRLNDHDAHPNERANALTAEAIARYLRENGSRVSVIGRARCARFFAASEAGPDLECSAIERGRPARRGAPPARPERFTPAAPWRVPPGKVRVAAYPPTNEARDVGPLLEAIDQAMYDDAQAYSVVVVDDGSVDRDPRRGRATGRSTCRWRSCVTSATAGSAETIPRRPAARRRAMRRERDIIVVMGRRQHPPAGASSGP